MVKGLIDSIQDYDDNSKSVKSEFLKGISDEDLNLSDPF